MSKGNGLGLAMADLNGKQHAGTENMVPQEEFRGKHALRQTRFPVTANHLLSRSAAHLQRLRRA